MPRKPATQKAQPAAQPATLSPQDAHNLLVFLDRVPTRGVNEAMVLGVLAQKLRVIRGEHRPESPQSAENSEE